MADERPDDRFEREMLEAFRRAMASRSARDAALTAMRLGDLYLESDNYSDALGYFTQATVDDLGDSLSDEELGLVLVRTAKCHAALGDYTEARAIIAELDDLELDQEEDDVWAEANVVLARVEIESGRYDEALRAAQKAYEVLRTRPDSELLAEAGKALGVANAELGNIQAARDYFTDYLVAQKRLGDEAGLAIAYNNLGVLAKRTGDLHAALEHLESALSIDRRLGRTSAIADRLTNIGIIMMRLSRHAEAEERLSEARRLYTRIGATRGLVATRTALGNLHRMRREWGLAREALDEALRLSRQHGYLRAEAVTLEVVGELEADQGEHENALGTLTRALGCAYRLGAASDVVGEVLRRRAEVLFALGRVDEAERDCSDGIKLARSIDDRLEEGALLRVLAEICYSRSDNTAAEVLVNRAEDILRRAGESFELARIAMVDAIGLRDSAAVGAAVPLDRIEARFSAAESAFARIGLPHWVALCELERGKALHQAGQPDRARPWLERARLKFTQSHDAHGVAQVDAALRGLDAELADAAIAKHARYALIADGYRFLETSEPTAGDLHRTASEIAAALGADRLVLFSVSGDGQPAVATSADTSGRGVGEVARFVRTTVANRGHRRPLVLSDGASVSGSVPNGVSALAFIPVQVGLSRDRSFLLYADRSGETTPFTQDDIEFVGAAARLLGLASSRVGDAAGWNADGALSEELGSSPEQYGIITRDPGLLAILASVERLRDSRVPVVIRGESGVGKELIARAIHEGGRSRKGRFVALNAGAIAPHLQESELFGHVKGAFTDADRDREGLVAAADCGTLFLDEIGEMSTELQVKLLRFLQNGEYRRVGESVTRTSDARVVSASNKDLGEEVKAGRFRRDLFYRLCAVVIEVPPLRERKDDIPLLMEHFLTLYSGKEGKPVAGFSREVRDLFMRHDWLGNNIRELENEVRRGVALVDEGGTIGLDKVSPELRARYEIAEAGDEIVRRSLKQEVESLEKSRILEALGQTGWNKQAAADKLGLSRPGLHAKMKKYGIG
ncbi:MAG: tetratricopeptide repeat protein [Candidatus Eisenbacteria bacterium]|nr:tetratricopeptide repeat protein [Candidatus Eisenbacteria bacterium]